MTTLPTGTVTLLFSDIEGSTKLLARLGPSYADALDGQRDILRAAWAEHAGVELGTEGDSFFVAFETASEAVAAAVQAQRALAARSWPAGEQVLVRMGVHTGTPTPHGDGYVGMDVHRAARIASVAHGGQILVSDSTARLAGLDGVTNIDLGLHTLKDLPEAEHLFQVVAHGLQREFRPVRSLGSASSLPATPTELVGRDVELSELTALLSEQRVRLVTLTGPGGAGKTRLALELAAAVAENSPDGVYFISLDSVTTSEVMWTTVATSLDAPSDSRTPPNIFDHLAHLRALLVLDNLEQVTGSDDVAASLLAEAPGIRVLATSRHPLHVAGEHEYPIPGLGLTEARDLDTAKQAGSVRLFEQHARMVRPAFRLSEVNIGAVTDICRRLDGLPLAIELAAARLKLLSPQALLSRLDNVLDIRSADARRADRQQTLRSTIEWSYELLDDQQQQFFRILGVFAGGADLEAIQAMAHAQGLAGDPFDLIEVLADASLVIMAEGQDGEPRIEMLHTLRAFAHDQLADAGALDAVRRHAAYYFGSMVNSPDRMGDAQTRSRYVDRLELEHENIRQTLTWLTEGDHDGITHAERVTAALEVASTFAYQHCYYRGFWEEGRSWCELALAQAAGREDEAVLDCRVALGWVVRTLGEEQRAHDLADAALTALTSRDRPFEQTAAAERLIAHALNLRGLTGHVLGDPDAALRDYESALERHHSDYRIRAMALVNLGSLRADQSRLDLALEHERAALAIATESGDVRSAAVAEGNMACTLRMLGRPQQARQLMLSVIPRVIAQRDPSHLVVVVEDYATVLSDLGDHRSAALLLGAAEAMRERSRIPRDAIQVAALDSALAKPIAELGPRWHELLEQGKVMTAEDVLAIVGRASPATNLT